MLTLRIENKTKRRDETYKNGVLDLIVDDEDAIRNGISIEQTLEFLEAHGVFDPASLEYGRLLRIDKDDMGRAVAKFTVKLQRDGGPQDYCSSTAHYLEVRRVSSERFLCMQKKWVYFS